MTPASSDSVDDFVSPATVERGRRVPPRALAATLLIVALLAGVVAGIGIERFLILPHQMWHRPRNPLHSFAGPTNEQKRRFRERLASELKLNPVQAHQVDSIMAAQETAFTALQREVRPRFEGLVRETHQKIDSILTPEQRALHDRHRLPEFRSRP